MSAYEEWILLPILDRVMRQKHLKEYRSRVVGAARGRALEVGVESGLNFRFHDEGVESTCMASIPRRAGR